MSSFELKAIGRVSSPLTDLASAPCQADEGAPEAWLVFEPKMLEGLRSLRTGDEVILITWLEHQPRLWRAFVGLAGGRCEIGEGRRDPSDRLQFETAHRLLPVSC